MFEVGDFIRHRKGWRAVISEKDEGDHYITMLENVPSHIGTINLHKGQKYYIGKDQLHLNFKIDIVTYNKIWNELNESL